VAKIKNFFIFGLALRRRIRYNNNVGEKRNAYKTTSGGRCDGWSLYYVGARGSESSRH
jgi:hypothetical protein